MCHYITLIAPTNDLAAVAVVMDRHGRASRRMENRSICAVLHDGERQYLTTRGGCDCGSVLSMAPEAPDVLERQLAAEDTRLRLKGWSDSKTARAIADRRKAEAKRKLGRAGQAIDSFDLWEAVITDLRKALKLPYAGLLIRSYSGVIEDETFKASRREVRSASLRDALADMAEDEVTVFHGDGRER